MKRLFSLAAFVLFAPLAAGAAEPQLFHLAVKDVPVENGKILDIEFQEVEHNDDFSIVQVTRRSGGSVSSSMFVMRGMCGMMRARGKQNVVPEPVAGEKGRYKATFPDTLPGPDKGFTMAQCDLLRY